MNYGGKPISDYGLWELGDILAKLEEAQNKREKASQHAKFDRVNNKKAMEFPPINPEFLKLLNEVKSEIRKKQG